MIDGRYPEYLAVLETDDARRQPERAKRLASFDRLFQTGPASFFGGADSFGTYRELRSAFAEGLHLTTVMLALSCFEKELGAKLYARGVKSRGTISEGKLVAAACTLDEIDAALLDRIRDLVSIHHAYATFRPPVRSSQNGSFDLHHKLGMHELTEQDAEEAVRVLAAFVTSPTSPG